MERGQRIMGFGHQIYRVRDPRADVLPAVANDLFKARDDRRLYSDALLVEEVILHLLAEHRPDRSIKTNVESYTALVLHGLGLHPAIFTPVFAIARMGGWSAHALVQLAENELIRPESRYVGTYQSPLLTQWVAPGPLRPLAPR